jgi:hypothetical protein
VSYDLPADWREVEIRKLVDDFQEIEQRYRIGDGWDGRPDEWERYYAETRELLERFFADYRRLAGAELIAAREAELEYDRIERLVALLRETDPDRVEVPA